MKKIIALAIASAFVAPAAMADATVYGFLMGGIEYSKVNNGGISQVRVVDNLSRIGFKGEDKLDNGLTALWKAENRIRVGDSKTSGGDTWGGRDTYVGLKGDAFGELWLGAFDDPVVRARADYMGGINDMDETVNTTTGIFRRGQGAHQTQAMWTSPSMGGVNVRASYMFGSKTATVSPYAVQGSVFYKNSMFQVGTTYKTTNDTSHRAAATSGAADGAKLTTLIVGGSYMPVKGLQISAGWNTAKSRTSAAGAETQQDGWALGAKYAVNPKVTVIASVASLGDQEVGGAKTANSGATSMNLGAAYSLSKKTQVAFTVTRVKLDTAWTALTNQGNLEGTGTGIKPGAGNTATASQLSLKTAF